MKTPQPFFPRTPTTFQGRFPNITTCEIRIEQDRYGNHSRDGKSTIDVYTEKRTLPAQVTCVNRQCNRGGLALEWYLDPIKKDEPYYYQGEFFCNGDEGTPAGRKKGDSCDNQFLVEVRANDPSSYKYQRDTEGL
ncbi:hypothetical protein [Neorhizobium galegae]|uniref:hypothetical protein n=1 Tax=Neorhizobium galegae TaxID=399 RepID=UPI0006224247|nr:hypothetical protein [Neorhizobium galegae]KAB1125573.1 hypothetical protein F4V90_00130 [Neorhizobium galegae]MCQ1805832.1 hypothetical protein [Neorhizobium galegae]CDZ59591.1 Hypothetical protein NGAL_HAMBI2566_35850 [Neorhizobium galegae bv. orientalis]